VRDKFPALFDVIEAVVIIILLVTMLAGVVSICGFLLFIFFHWLLGV